MLSSLVFILSRTSIWYHAVQYNHDWEMKQINVPQNLMNHIWYSHFHSKITNEPQPEPEGGCFQLYYKTFYLLKRINYHSDRGGKTHLVDCVHVFQSFDHVDNLEVIEMGFSYCMHLKGWRALHPQTLIYSLKWRQLVFLGELCLYI